MRLPLPRFLFKLVFKGDEEATDLFLAMWQKVKALVSAKVLAHRIKVINQVDVRGLLPKLTIPCLYIHATSDRSVPESFLPDFTEAISDLRVKRIKGPHFILQAKPQAFVLLCGCTRIINESDLIKGKMKWFWLLLSLSPT